MVKIYSEFDIEKDKQIISKIIKGISNQTVIDEFITYLKNSIEDCKCEGFDSDRIIYEGILSDFEEICEENEFDLNDFI